jgi:uncharacterized membrane protein
MLRLHNLGSIETPLYSVGLGLVFMMFTGLFSTTIYPLLGYANAISFEILFITAVVAMQALLYSALFLDRGHTGSPYCSIDRLPVPAIPFLAVLPFLAVIGTYVRNEFHMVSLLFLLLIIIALVGLAVGFDRMIPRSCYPLAVFSIALALLYHISLISGYVGGYDIHHELYLANTVLQNGLWDMTIPYNTNGMLSIVALVPLYSILCNMDPVWVFKIIYPFLFALVPLGLYRAVERQVDGKVAFLSMFFFVAFFTFYTEMISLARQQIAEIFLVLTILALIDRSMDSQKRLALLLTFGAAMIVSHYGLSYIYMLSLVPAWLLLVVTGWPAIKALERRIRRTEAPDPFTPSIAGHSAGRRTLVLPYIIFFILFAQVWYMVVAEGSAFNTVMDIGDRIWTTLMLGGIGSGTAQGMHILTSQAVSPLHGLAKILHIATQGLIAIGVLAAIFRRDRWKFEPEYLAFSVVFLFISIAGIAVPFFASSLNTSRLYHITLIFLAPFAIVGGIAMYTAALSRLHTIQRVPGFGTAYTALSVFFAVFLLFNTGLVYQVANDSPTSMALETTQDKPVFNSREVEGARWLISAENRRPIYVDGMRWWLLLGFGPETQRYLPANAALIEPNSYLYFGTFNVVREDVRVEVKEGTITVAAYTDTHAFIKNRNRIYDNAGAAIYYR